MATAPQRSGFAETSSSRRVLGSPLWYRVGPWPAILGWTRNLYSSIRSCRSSSVASLPLPRRTPAGVASLSFCTPVGGDALLVVDAAVQGDVDAEGQESHAASLGHRNSQLASYRCVISRPVKAACIRARSRT